MEKDNSFGIRVLIDNEDKFIPELNQDTVLRIETILLNASKTFINISKKFINNNIDKV